MYEMPEYGLKVGDEVILDSEDNNNYYIFINDNNGKNKVQIPKKVSYATGTSLEKIRDLKLDILTVYELLLKYFENSLEYVVGNLFDESSYGIINRKYKLNNNYFVFKSHNGYSLEFLENENNVLFRYNNSINLYEFKEILLNYYGAAIPDEYIYEFLNVKELKNALTDYFRNDTWFKKKTYVKMIKNTYDGLYTMDLTIGRKYECVGINAYDRIFTITVIDDYGQKKVWPIDNFGLIR